MTLAVFHDFPGLENGLTKFHDFPRFSRKSGHPVLSALQSFKSETPKTKLMQQIIYFLEAAFTIYD